MTFTRVFVRVYKGTPSRSLPLPQRCTNLNPTPLHNKASLTPRLPSGGRLVLPRFGWPDVQIALELYNPDREPFQPFIGLYWGYIIGLYWGYILGLYWGSIVVLYWGYTV